MRIKKGVFSNSVRRKERGGGATIPPHQAYTHGISHEEEDPSSRKKNSMHIRLIPVALPPLANSINIKTNQIKVSSIQGRKGQFKRNVVKIQIQRKNHCTGTENRDFISDIKTSCEFPRVSLVSQVTINIFY